MKPLLAVIATFLLFAPLAIAQNSVPFVNQPLIPASVAPGGAGFTLTVNGTGFVSGSTVNWNGSPRTTTFISQAQVTASILATDIATATTASITVVSPAPGGGTSNVVFLPVREPSTFVSLNSTSFGIPEDANSVATGDFNNDGIQDLAVLGPSATPGVLILLGNGDGTFAVGSDYALPGTCNSIAVADLNNDGNLDLLVSDDQGGVIVLLGNGNGTFQQSVEYFSQVSLDAMATADFNRDGKLDVATTWEDGFCIFLGNGDGTLQNPTCITVTNSGTYALSVGDFNGDGDLDVALPSASSSATVVYVALGNGDGTFQTAHTYPLGGTSTSRVTADFNGDGKLDLAAALNNNESAASVMLGNGDGSFQSPTTYTTALDSFSISSTDMNGDGKLDLIALSAGFGPTSISVLLGNGNGTFQPHVDYDGSLSNAFAIADFNGDGRPDVSTVQGGEDVTIMTQDNGTVVKLSENKIIFATQLVGTVSQPRPMTLTNTGTAPVTISNITIDPNFSQLNNCRTVQPNGSCRIAVYFTPTTTGNLVGYLAIADNGGGSPQTVALSGVATIVSLSPSSLNFGNQKVGTVSKSQNVTLTNEGNSNLDISKIGIGGANAADFSEVNACASKIAAGGSCTITVLFHPNAQGAANATLEVEDNGGGSPQKVPLSGTGT